MRRNLMLFGAAFAAGLIIVVGATAGERFFEVPGLAAPAQPDAAPTIPQEPVQPAPTPADVGDFTEFRDEEWGFAVSYPSSWEQVATDDPSTRLLTTLNGAHSILVRAVTLDAEISEDDLADVRAFTDPIVLDGEGVEVLAEPSGVVVGGLPGIYYLYTFTDAASGEEGVHLHYFLFDGDTMITIVLQALPSTDLDPLAPTFQTVIESFDASI